MAYWSNGLCDLYHCDARSIPLPDQSVHCVVTSPPYYGLRKYRAEGKVIGLEATPEEWLDAMMEVFGEVGRVLRDDGICWVNLGDSYAGSGGAHTNDTSPGLSQSHKRSQVGPSMGQSGNLMNMPHRFALAMQAQGWIHRDTVIWHKLSSMPESLNGTRWEKCRVKVHSCAVGGDLGGKAMVTGERQKSCVEETWLAQWSDCPGCDKCAANDGLVLRKGSWRCTQAYEVILMFVKGMGYWSDGEAVKTVALQTGHIENTQPDRGPNNGRTGFNMSQYVPSTANRRNVWSDIKPEPFGGQHYATFPSGLPRLCIQASTSEAGVCAGCGAQWARVVESPTGGSTGASWHDHANDDVVGDRQVAIGRGDNFYKTYQPAQTLSWRPTCGCKAPKVAAVVLDPFAGTGTTLLAAMRLGRRGVGTDLSTDYLDMAIKRLSGQTLPMEMGA